MIIISIALFGCGSSGFSIACQLALNNFTSHIKLIDINNNKSKKLLEELLKINEKINYESIKTSSNKSNLMIDLLRDVDVVINSASPLCNIPLMKACLASNTNYVDLASDPFKYSGISKRTTLDEQLKLHSDFIEKNLIAVTNTGFSPGFTDIMCRYIVDTLSLVSINYFKVSFAEALDSEKFVISWSPYMLLLESILPSTIYDSGNIKTVDTTINSKYIKFPKPIGLIRVHPFNGHPELRTLPEFLPIPIRYIEICGGMRLNNMQLNDIIVEALRRQAKKSVIFNGDILKILSKSFDTSNRFTDLYRNGIIKNDIGCCIIEICGKRNNNIIKYKAMIQHNIKKEFKKIPNSISAFFVSFIPSIIAYYIINGKITEKGVIAPAAIDKSSLIIDECKKMGMNIKESDILDCNNKQNF